MKFYPIFTVMIFLTLIPGCIFVQEVAKEAMKESTNNRETGAPDENCWADLFKNPDFGPEDSHVRLVGPIESSTLDQLEGKNWNDEIQSLIMGPHATVHVYQNREFAGMELIFMPNQRISDELIPVGMSKNIKSLKVQCRTG